MKTSVIRREPQKSVDTRKSNAAKAVSTRVDTFDPGRSCVHTHRLLLSSTRWETASQESQSPTIGDGVKYHEQVQSQ
jgi:hypothetical protein